MPDDKKKPDADPAAVPRYTLGQTVYLNSGGPGMTIVGRRQGKKPEDSGFYYQVAWITEGTVKLRSAELPEEAVHLIQRGTAVPTPGDPLTPRNWSAKKDDDAK